MAWCSKRYRCDEPPTNCGIQSIPVSLGRPCCVSWKGLAFGRSLTTDSCAQQRAPNDSETHLVLEESTVVISRRTRNLQALIVSTCSGRPAHSRGTRAQRQLVRRGTTAEDVPERLRPHRLHVPPGLGRSSRSVYIPRAVWSRAIYSADIVVARRCTHRTQPAQGDGTVQLSAFYSLTPTWTTCVVDGKLAVHTVTMV